MELSISQLEIDVLKDFLVEAREHLGGIEERILQMETDQDIELVNSIFRPAHTIKGSASFLGLNDIKYLAHEMETLLDELRNNKLQVSTELIDTLLTGVDTLGRMLQKTAVAVEEADQENDPVVFSLPDISLDEVVADIQDIREKGKKQVSESAEEQKEKKIGKILLSRGELVSIVYPPGMKEQFIDEGFEHIATLEESLLELEKKRDNLEQYNDLFRALHSLKGNSGVLLSVVDNPEFREKHPLLPFQELSHEAETLVQQRRDTASALVDEEIELLLAVVDILKDIVMDFQQDEADPEGIEQLLTRCRVLTGVEREGGEQPGSDDVREQAARSFALDNTLSQCVEAVSVGLDEISDDNKRDKALRKVIRGFKTISKSGRNSGLDKLAADAEEAVVVAEFLLNGKDDNELIFLEDLQDKLKEIKKNLDETGLEETGSRHDVQPPETMQVGEKNKSIKDKSEIQSPAGPAAVKSAGQSGVTGQVIKVSQEKLDKLMNLVGELIVSKNNFPPLAREISEEYNLPRMGKKVKAAGDLVGRISDDLQATVMAIRMVPVSTVFSRFPRMIRDLSRKMDKQINLVISGEETELDKTIIEALGDPMVHLVRNSADHGLESPEKRKESGKTAEGTIHLKAYNQGQHVIIEIQDDGAGIDPNVIRSKAIEKAMISLDELENMDDRAVINLIFAAGFSTAGEITEVSGRGVGMDVVRTNIERIGGMVLLDSRLGRGTTVTIKLPLTLAVCKGLEVAVGNEHYFLPLDYVRETVKIDPNMVRNHKDMRMTVVRQDLLPIKRLASLLELDGNAVNSLSDTKEKSDLSLVILNLNGRKIALEVDRFFNENEFVIKSLDGSLAGIDGLSGATVTGDGKVILILDPLRLL